MDDLDLGSTVKGFAPGQKVFSRYTLKKILGRGGMGVVWLARDEELEREVALKFLPEVVAMDSEALRDLKRETRRSLELTHPHVIRIYDFVQDERMAAISMEYVAGETLAQRKLAQPEQCFEPAELLPWLTQLLEALDHAHRKARVVHRDLKPANLMLDAQGDLKIADFGIAASVSDSVSRVSAQAGSSGTPVYMSPQQMMGEKPAVTDDIYSVGATLFDLLTGKPPFYSGNVIAQVQSRVAPTLADRRLELGVKGRGVIPPTWSEAIAACLAKDPAQRPQTARELLDRLRGVAPAATAPARTAVEIPSQPKVAVPTPPRAPAPAPVSPDLPQVSNARRWWWAPVAASMPWTCAAFAAAVAGWLTSSDSDPVVLIGAVFSALLIFAAQYCFFALLLAIRRPWKVRRPYGIMALGALLGGTLGWTIVILGEYPGEVASALVGAVAGALQGWLLHRIAVGIWAEDAPRVNARQPLVIAAAAAAFLVTVVFYSVVLPGWIHERDEARRIAREQHERYEAEKERLRLEEEARVEEARLAAIAAENERLRLARAAEDARNREQLRAQRADVIKEAFQGVLDRLPTASEVERYQSMLDGRPERNAAWVRKDLRDSPEGQKGGRLLVPKEFPTIRQALAAASPGNVIEVGPGTYKESIVLDKPVSLRGAGRDRTTIEVPATSAAFVASDISGVTISGFTFRHTSTHEEQNRSSVIALNSCNLRFERNHVVSGNGNGLHMRGAGKNVILGNTFRRSRWVGIALYAGASGEIRENEVLENEQAGMAGYDPVPGTLIVDNVFHSNKHSGFWLTDGTDVTLVGNRVHHNGVPGTNYGGIGIVKGTPRLRGNVAENNVGTGIWFNPEVRPRIEAGNISDGQLMPVTP